MDISSVPNVFQVSIKRAIGEEIQKIVDEEAKEASARLEKRVRETMPGIAMSVFDNWTSVWENGGRTLAIRVDFKETK